MKPSCRSCELDVLYREIGIGDIKHETIYADYKCIICNNDSQWLSHKHEALYGDALECSKCHDYIIYISPENILWKDEIYTNDPDYYIIRSFEDNYTDIYEAGTGPSFKNKKVFSNNNVLKIENTSSLIQKIKTLMVFL